MLSRFTKGVCMFDISSDESCAGALDELIQGVKLYKKSDELAELLDAVQQFPILAPFNAMLVSIQKPGARFVLPPEDWQRYYGRTVVPGSRPLIIMWPNSPVRFVYDYSDTEGEESLPFAEIVSDAVTRFKRTGRFRWGSSGYDRIVRNVQLMGVGYAESDHGSASGGFIQRNPHERVLHIENKRIRSLYTIVINKHLDIELKYSVLLHELGHLFCGHLGSPDNRLWKSRMGLSKTQKEFEAESVAYLLSRNMGIQSSSKEYLAGYADEHGNLPPYSLHSIMFAVRKIERILSPDVTTPKSLLIKGAPSGNRNANKEFDRLMNLLQQA